MTANLKILVPEGTTNYIKNPSMRYAATDWTAIGSVVTRVLTQALYGIASLQVVTNGLAVNEGVYYRVNDFAGISEPITASIYARGAGSVHLRLIEGIGKQWISKVVTLRSDRWQRMIVSGYSTGVNDMRMYIETDGGAKPITFFITAAQMERKAYSTSYCDGDQPGCYWNIMDSQSTSTRLPSTRQGGRWIGLAGPCRENDNIYVTSLGGMGMAPITNNLQSWALTPGSFYQNTKILDRVLTFAFNVKNENLQITGKPNISPLHRLRQQLIDILKPDLTGSNEPFLISYQEGEREIFIPVRYEAGLEGDWDIRNSWVNSFPIRFVAVDPIFFENNLNAQSLCFGNNSLVNNIVGRINGQWNDFGAGLNSSIYSICKGRYGEVYVAGNSSISYKPPGAISNISYWDGTQWNSVSTTADGIVRCISIAPNGDLYVTGEFTHIGGVACNYIARWNGSTWNALGTGLNAKGMAVKCVPNGNVYVGGYFTTAGGATANYVAYWDGAAWHPLGVSLGLTGNYVMSIDSTKDGSVVYMGGLFSSTNGGATSNALCVAQYVPATNVLSGIGSGFNLVVAPAIAIVYAVKLSPAGVLYAGGRFDHTGTAAVAYIAKWNGSAWIPLGNGFNSIIYAIDINENEQVVAGGEFTASGNMSADRIAMWNGSDWISLDIDVPSAGVNGIIYSILFSKSDLYIGGDIGLVSMKTNYACINNIVNYGTAISYPIIYILGPGLLRWIENQTTGKKIYLNATIINAEEVFIDFGKKKIYSTTRGDITYFILSGSDFADFLLIPGNNVISILMTDDVNSKMVIYHKPQHWSADATVDAEALT